MSETTYRYIVTRRYGVIVTETQLQALRKYYARERNVAPESLETVDVLADTVTEFEVGNNTDIVTEIDLAVDGHQGKFFWEDQEVEVL